MRASGTLIGMTLYHGDAHVARAVYEGIMQALNTCAQVLAENALPVRTLTLIGGGAKSPLWGQMAASMLGVPARIHCAPHEATSLGAAFAAGVGIGVYADFHEAAQQIRHARTYQPDEREHEAYDRHGKVYRSLYPAMKDAFGAIYDYQHTEKGE